MTARLMALALVVASAALSGAPAEARGQSVTATAVILAPPVTGAGVRVLDFGTVPVGAPTAVAPGPATTSGQFTLGGLKKAAGVSVTFTLPDSLASFVVPSNKMRIAFAGATAMGCVELKSPPNPCTTWDPTLAGGTHNVANAGTLGQRTGNFYIYIGGSVTPPATVVAGAYVGTIRLTYAAY